MWSPSGSVYYKPSVFLAGDFSTSFSSGLDFSGDFGFSTVFFSLSAVLRDEHILIQLSWQCVYASIHVVTVQKVSDVPDTVKHRLFLSGRFGDGPLGAYYLALMLLFSCLAVLVLIWLRSAILS